MPRDNTDARWLLTVYRSMNGRTYETHTYTHTSETVARADYAEYERHAAHDGYHTRRAVLVYFDGHTAAVIADTNA